MNKTSSLNDLLAFIERSRKPLLVRPTPLDVFLFPAAGALRGAALGQAVGHLVAEAADDADAVDAFRAVGALLGLMAAVVEFDRAQQARATGLR